MRKSVVLPALAVLLSTLTAVLAGCGSSAPAEQSAAPTTTAAPSQEAAAAPSAANPQPTPTSAPATDDNLEFPPTDSAAISGKQEGTGSSDREASKGDGATPGAVQGQAHTWEDGDRTLTVHLQDDLVVAKGSDGMPRDIVAADDGGTNVVRSADAQSRSGTLPVFRSESGDLLTLPGGVLLVLDSTWSEAQVNSFFSDNGIKLDQVSELSYAANGFFIETEPGFPSLDLANELAALDGVEVASPNWGREAVPK